MKEETKTLIKKIALRIDKDKYNIILTSKHYDEYLEKILTVLVEGAISLESNKDVK